MEGTLACLSEACTAQMCQEEDQLGDLWFRPAGACLRGCCLSTSDCSQMAAVMQLPVDLVLVLEQLSNWKPKHCIQKRWEVTAASSLMTEPGKNYKC